MKKISDKAVQAIRESNTLIAKLMIAFNRGQNTIENWMNSKSPMLTTANAISIIREETNLTEDEILVDIEGKPKKNKAEKYAKKK